MELDQNQIQSLVENLPQYIQRKYELELKPNSTHESSLELSRMIDHTLLAATATEDDIKKLCAEAIEHNFFSVCIPPCHIQVAAQILKNEQPKICTVIGFPLGNQTSASKTFEARNAIEMGADEIDMVIKVGSLKAKKYDRVFQEIETIKQICGNKVLKVILETCYLTEEEIAIACMLSRAAGADFVKTSTGFGTSGAKVEHVKLMKQIVGPHMFVKASGGIRSKEDALKMKEAGASRLGCSAGVAIVKGETPTTGTY